MGCGGGGSKTRRKREAEGGGGRHKTVLCIDKNQDTESCSSCKRVMNRGGMREDVFQETGMKRPGQFAVS